MPDEYLNEPFKLRLPGIDRLTEFINLKGPGCLVFKKDLKRAYDPHDLLGFTVDGQFYFYTVMPFGSRSATLTCQRTTKAIVHILNQEGILVDIYIEDFYGAETAKLATQSFDRMTHLFSELGLQLSPAKDTPPMHTMTCLEISVNTLTMALTVPEFRLHELQHLLSSWLDKTHFSKWELQQLLGKLAFVTACVCLGRAFSCRFLNALRACFASPRHQLFPVSDVMHEDLIWGKFFLQHYNGVSVIPTAIIVSDPEWFVCDACLDACGVVCFGNSSMPRFLLSLFVNI